MGLLGNWWHPPSDRDAPAATAPRAIKHAPGVDDALTFKPSDREREAVVDALRRQTADGRLDYGELARRVEGVLEAQTIADVNQMVGDLPVRLAIPEVKIVPVARPQELRRVPAPSGSLPPMSEAVASKHRPKAWSPRTRT